MRTVWLNIRNVRKTFGFPIPWKPSTFEIGSFPLFAYSAKAHPILTRRKFNIPISLVHLTNLWNRVFAQPCISCAHFSIAHYVARTLKAISFYKSFVLWADMSSINSSWQSSQETSCIKFSAGDSPRFPRNTLGKRWKSRAPAAIRIIRTVSDCHGLLNAAFIFILIRHNPAA